MFNRVLNTPLPCRKKISKQLQSSKVCSSYHGEILTMEKKGMGKSDKNTQQKQQLREIHCNLLG